MSGQIFHPHKNFPMLSDHSLRLILMIQKQISANYFSCTYQFSIKRNKYFMQHVFFSNKTRLTHLMLNWMPFQLFWALQEEAITSSLENLLEELAVITPTEKNKQQTILHYSVFLYSKLLKKSFLTSSVTSQQWSWMSRGYFLCWKCTFASHKS